MSRIYATFDPSNMGADLVLERGATVVTTATIVDNHRMVRGSIGQAEYLSDVECLVYGDDALTGGAAYVGIVAAAAATSKYVGEDAAGYGYRLDTGELVSNGVVLATWGTAAKGDILRITVDPGGASPSVAFWKGDTLLGTQALAVGETWYFAATVSGPTAGGLKCYANAGQQRFQSQAISSGGWWTTRAQIGTLRVASAAYRSKSTDARPSLRFRAGLKPRAQLSWPTGVRFWPWDSAMGVATGVGSAKLFDPDGYASELLTGDARDTTVDALRVEDGGSLDDAEVLGQLVVDQVRAEDDSTLHVVLRDRLSVLDRALITPLVLLDADPSAADRMVPILIGGARAITPMLVDAEERRYVLSDVPIGGLQVRLNGKLLDGTGATPDFTMTTDACGIVLAADAAGTLTCDATDLGGSATDGTDLLAGGGEFNVYANDAETDTYWTRGHDLAVGTGGEDPAWSNAGDGVGRMVFPGYSGVGDSWTWLEWSADATLIKAGRSYRAEVYIQHIPERSQTSALALLRLMAANGSSPQFGVEYARWVDESDPWNTPVFTDPGIYEAVWTNTTESDQKFQIQFKTISNLGDAKITWIKLYELPSATTVIDLGGVSLEEYCRRVIEIGGRLPPTAWRASDAAAIDAATGYLIGNWISTPTSVLGALRPALDSFGADVFRHTDGSIGIGRIIAPEDVADVDCAAPLDDHDFLEMLEVWDDLAPGLTLRAGARHNFTQLQAADYGSDTDPATGVPMAARRLLSAEYGAEVAAGVQLPNIYQHAIGADVLPTLFDDAADAQAEITRVATIYTVKRQFFRARMAAPPGRKFTPCEVRACTYAGRGLVGHKLMVATVDPEPLAESAVVTFWGLTC